MEGASDDAGTTSHPASIISCTSLSQRLSSLAFAAAHSRHGELVLTSSDKRNELQLSMHQQLAVSMQWKRLLGSKQVHQPPQRRFCLIKGKLIITQAADMFGCTCSLLRLWRCSEALSLAESRCLSVSLSCFM